MWEGGYLTIQLGVNGILDLPDKDGAIPPDIDNSPDLSLNVRGSALIRDRRGISDEGRKGLEEVVLVTRL